MIKKNIIFQYLFLLVLIFILSIEKIKLSWEISTLYNNSENIKVELEKLKDLNLKLITQYHLENSPAIIEKIAKEDLGINLQSIRKMEGGGAGSPATVINDLRDIISRISNSASLSDDEKSKRVDIAKQHIWFVLKLLENLFFHII